MRLNEGLIFMSDTRTNAGVDDISQVRKTTNWCTPGERVITILSAGNLATTQSVVSLLEERSKAPQDREPTLMRLPTMFRVAELVGETLREIVQKHKMNHGQSQDQFGATLLVGGQIAGSPPRLFMVYPEGNFVEASDDNPFFQTGEIKYGRPILVRAYRPDLSFAEAVKLLTVSFDSTIKSNIGVDLPVDLTIHRKDGFVISHSLRFERNDPYFRDVSEKWGDSLRSALSALPDFSF